MKIMSVWLLVLVFCLVVVTNVSAQDVTLTTKTKSMYLGGDGGDFYSHPVQQTNLNLGWKNGIYANIWASAAGNFQRDFDKEVDLIFGYSGKLGKLSTFQYSADAGYFFLSNIVDVMNVNGEITLTTTQDHAFTVVPFLRTEFYFPTQRGGPQKGVMGIAGLQSRIAIGKRLNLSLRAYTKKDSGNFGFDSAVLGQGQADLSISLSEKVSLLTGMDFSTPLSQVRDGRKNYVVPMVGLSYRF